MFMVNTGKYTSPMDPIIVRNTHMFQLGGKKDNTNNSRYIVNQINMGYDSHDMEKCHASFAKFSE